MRFYFQIPATTPNDPQNDPKYYHNEFQQSYNKYYESLHICICKRTPLAHFEINEIQYGPRLHQNTSRYTCDIVVDRNEKKQNKPDGLTLRLQKSPSSNTWKSSKPASTDELAHFVDLREDPPKEYELYLQEKLPRSVRSCHVVGGHWGSLGGHWGSLQGLV